MNEELVEFIKRWEGLKLQSSGDPIAGTNGSLYRVYDVGYGHVIPSSAHPLTITRGEADALLMGDLVMIAGEVDDMVTATILPNERDALISFAYNVGVNALRKSTLLKRLNNLDYECWSELRKYVISGGRKREGLVKRRYAEEDMARYSDYTGAP